MTPEIIDIIERLKKELKEAEQAGDFIIITKRFINKLETEED
jgi:hypothetical protein